MSCGFDGPSISGSPARTRSPSCTLTCTPRGSAYSRGSAPGSSGTMMIFRWPLTMPPCLTMPSISEMTAVSRGFRASNSSTTRGRPPVMSLVLVVSRGIFASTSPADTISPSWTIKCACDRHVVLAVDLAVLALNLDRRLLLLVRRVDDDQAREAGDLVDFLVHRDAFENVLEADLARLLGEDRERVRIPFDQHLALLDRLAFLHLQPRAVDDRVALAVAPLHVLHDQRSAPVHDDQVAVLRLRRPGGPGTGRAGVAAPRVSTARTRDAVPPMWNVRIVSCVPGSPMDCAAMTPTAWPSSTILPVARSRP